MSAQERHKSARIMHACLVREVDGALHHVQSQQPVALSLSKERRRVAQRAQAADGVRGGQRFELLFSEEKGR